MLYSSSDDSESIHPQSTTTLDLSKKSVPIPIVGFTNDSTSTDELIAFDSPKVSRLYPSFYNEIIDRQLPKKEHLALVKAQKWVTDALQLEIDHNSPQVCAVSVQNYPHAPTPMGSHRLWEHTVSSFSHYGSNRGSGGRRSVRPRTATYLTISFCWMRNCAI